MRKSVLSKNLPPLPSLQESNHCSTPVTINFTFEKYSQLPWTDYFDTSRDLEIDNDIFRIYETNNESKIVFVFIHGGGFTGLTWSVCAKHIKLLSQQHGGCRILCYDSRGHGYSQTTNDSDMSLETQAKDLFRILQALNIDKHQIILVGHSMGGPVAVHCAIEYKLNLIGIAVLDVVEGTALDSLESMRSILEARPKTFSSLSDAIAWTLDSHAVQNIESASVSVPSQLKLLPNGSGFTWRADLASSSVFWEDWFSDLTRKFLSVKAAKMLMVAGADRIDKAMMIAQMQGKFQTVIINESGHAMQEDEPEKVAKFFIEFWKRNERLVLPNKFNQV